jgi:hypothetical protein
LRYRIPVTGLRDPANQKVFDPSIKDGRHPDVQKWIREDKRVQAVVDAVKLLAFSHIIAHKDTFVSIGIHDYHGKWIAPAIGEIVAAELDPDFKVSLIHKGLMPNAGKRD